MQYVLHIGTNKTGTSTLQHFLGSSRAELLGRGIHYPRVGKNRFAHHEVAQAIKEDDFGKYGLEPEALTSVPKEGPAQDAAAGAAEVPVHTVLLSSENFHTVRRVEAVARWFPPDSTQVVLYLREHVSYFASWYQQAVQARDVTCSFMDFVKVYGYNLADLVDRWRTIYGERLKVRVYDRSQLAEGDIVVDFFRTAFKGAPPAARTFEDKNPSISGNLFFLKKVLNHVLTREENAAIVEELSTLSYLDKRFGGRILVEEDDVKRVAAMYAKDRQALRQRHGVAIRAADKAIGGNPAPELERLPVDIAALLGAAKEKGFAFHDIYEAKRRLLFP